MAHFNNVSGKIESVLIIIINTPLWSYQFELPMESYYVYQRHGNLDFGMDKFGKIPDIILPEKILPDFTRKTMQNRADYHISISKETNSTQFTKD